LSYFYVQIIRLRLKQIINASIVLYDKIFRWIYYNNQSKNLKAADIKKIVIIETSRIGDIVATFPALDVIRHKFENSEITYLVSFKCLDLIKYDPRVNFVKTLQNKNRIFHIFNLVRDIRFNQNDLVIVLNYSIINSILAYAIGARSMLGYLIDRNMKMSYHKNLGIESRGIDVDIKKQSYSKYEHIQDRALKVVNSLGGESKGVMKLHLKKQKDSQVSRTMQNRLDKPNLTFVFHLGAEWEFRRWSVEKFSELGNILYKKYRADIIIIGGKNEHIIADKFTKGINFKCFNFVGNLQLAQSAHIISKADLFVGSDSGPMHIASALGIPVIALFGPNIPEVSGPKYNSIIIQKKLDCIPCDQRFCVRKNDLTCMDRIQVKDVVSAVEKILKINQKVRVLSN